MTKPFTAAVIKPTTLTAATRAMLSAWSYSRWTKYGLCPAALAHNVFDKRKEPQNAAMARGESIHKEAELFVKGVIKKLPKSLILQERVLKENRDRGATAEEEWAFTNKWEPTEWWESKCPPDKMVWCRVKTDAHLALKKGVVQIDDYKSGRVQDRGYEPQLELYALAGFKMFEGVAAIKARFIWIDHKINPTERTYLASMEGELQHKWELRVRDMMRDTKFLPRPGTHCKGCFHAKSKGGPCTADIYWLGKKHA